MPTAPLPDRAVLEVSGDDARAFLDRLITCDLDRVAPGRPRYGALLTPQGKIIADFILFAGEAGYRLDTPAATVADFAKRLTLYRLRAKITIADRSDALAVRVGWDEPAPAEALVSADDPREPELGWRAIVPRGAAGPTDAAVLAAYEARRIALAVPDGGRDFAFGDAFPHEAVMDQLGGVDFDKGCYVGQEVVSRMQHRGTARTRLVAAFYPDGAVPEPGTPITAGDKVLGTVGTGGGGRGLATIRLDRAQDALGEGVPILADGRPVRFAAPRWARFPVPGADPAA